MKRHFRTKLNSKVDVAPLCSLAGAAVPVELAVALTLQTTILLVIVDRTPSAPVTSTNWVDVSGTAGVPVGELEKSKVPAAEAKGVVTAAFTD